MSNDKLPEDTKHLAINALNDIEKEIVFAGQTAAKGLKEAVGHKSGLGRVRETLKQLEKAGRAIFTPGRKNGLDDLDDLKASGTEAVSLLDAIQDTIAALLQVLPMDEAAPSYEAVQRFVDHSRQATDFVEELGISSKFGRRETRSDEEESEREEASEAEIAAPAAVQTATTPADFPPLDAFSDAFALLSINPKAKSFAQVVQQE